LLGLTEPAYKAYNFVNVAASPPIQILTDCAELAVLMVELKFTAKNPSDFGSTKDHQLSEPSRPITNN
jgi:hypothetical protein